MNAKQLRQTAIDAPHFTTAHVRGFANSAFLGPNVECRVIVDYTNKPISTRYELFGERVSAAEIDGYIAQHRDLQS